MAVAEGGRAVALAVDVQPELDRGRVEVSLDSGDRGCGRPFVNNDCFIHRAGELPSSPAFFHDIYALQRTRAAVTPAASILPPSPALPQQPSRQRRVSLSLRSLGVARRHHNESFQ